MSGRESLFPFPRWIVAVRHETDDLTWDYYGVYGSEKSAEKKAAAINKAIALRSGEVAYAYAVPLNHATIPARPIAERAVS